MKNAAVNFNKDMWCRMQDYRAVFLSGVLDWDRIPFIND